MPAGFGYVLLVCIFVLNVCLKMTYVHLKV